MSQLEQLFSQALGISAPWKITALRFDPSTKNLDIDVDFERGSTFAYEDPETGALQYYKAYDTIQKTWRHLNFFEHTCYLHARVPRIQPHQGGTKMILPPWSGVVAGFTLLFEAFAMQICRSMPIHQASKILQTTDHKLWHMLDAYVFKVLAVQNLSDVTCVGTDETAVAKGHEYISLFVDLTQKKTIFITEGKDHKTVIEFAKVVEDSGGSPNKITDVSCDMSPAFIKGVHEALPNAQITFDKFHILKIINKAVDEVRRSEVREIPALRGARYALMKNINNLTAKQKETRERLSQMNLKSMKAVHMRENFQAIYQADSADSFEKLLKQWYSWAIRCRLEPMVKAARTIKKHWDGILRWKTSKISNGILEGFNSIIQAAKRKARGYKAQHFKTMTYLLTGKLELKIFNPYLPTHF